MAAGFGLRRRFSPSYNQARESPVKNGKMRGWSMIANSLRMCRPIAVLGMFLVIPAAPAAETADAKLASIKVPAGFVVERVAGPPLVERPMMGAFDERGRLFLAESAGKNLKA